MLDLKINTSFSIPFRPRPGQAILFVDLTDASYPLEILNRLVQLGYEPVLKYRQFPNGKLNLSALLKFEQHESSFPTEDYMMEEWSRLCESSGIDPNRIHCQVGCFQQSTIAA